MRTVKTLITVTILALTLSACAPLMVGFLGGVAVESASGVGDYLYDKVRNAVAE